MGTLLALGGLCAGVAAVVVAPSSSRGPAEFEGRSMCLGSLGPATADGGSLWLPPPGSGATLSPAPCARNDTVVYRQTLRRAGIKRNAGSAINMRPAPARVSRRTEDERQVLAQPVSGHPESALRWTRQSARARCCGR